MRDVYIICLIIGFLLLLLSVAGEFLESFIGAVEALLNFDISLDLAFLPLSGVSICSALITFGGIGFLLMNPWIAGIGAYIAAMAVQTLIRRLKKVKNESMDREELYLCEGRIINTILPGGLGTVEFDNIKGISTTYACHGENRAELIKQNTEVVLVDFEGEIAIVKSKDIFAEYRQQEQEK